MKGHSRDINFLVKINENTIASTSWDNTMKIWNIITGKCLTTLKFNFFVYSIYKINGNSIMSDTNDKNIKIWDIITGNCQKTLVGHSDSVLFLVKIN